MLNIVKYFCYSLLWLFAPISFCLRLLGIRVLDLYFEAFGPLALEPEIYLKEQMLLRKKKIVFLFPRRFFSNRKKFMQLDVSNLFLLQCWSKHYILIKNLFFYIFLYPIFKSPILKVRANQDVISIFNRFEQSYGSDKGFTPFLKLNQKEIKKGKLLLQHLGLPEDAWYVCFNCREKGYYSDETCSSHLVRNASIANMDLAIREIIRRGGWCIRVGSPFMQRLPECLSNYEQVIDYPHTSYVSDFMDVFLLATCRFFLGNNSGITNVPGAFGVPCVLTNAMPIGHLALYAHDLTIFKLHQCAVTGQLVPFANCFRSYFSESLTWPLYEECQIKLIENSKEEILDVVIEILDKLDGTLSYSLEEENLQHRFKSCMCSANTHRKVPSRIGKEFLKKYQNLLKPQLCSKHELIGSPKHVVL